MKHNFMNKENGKVASVLVMYLDDEGHMQTDSYDKVEDLMEDYAAYEPARPEPLIKDEKIRKAVRAWAEANDITEIIVFDCNNGTCLKVNELEFAENGGRATIMFKTNEKIDTDRRYTIAELCGEEEE